MARFAQVDWRRGRGVEECKGGVLVKMMWEVMELYELERRFGRMVAVRIGDACAVR